MSERNKYFDSSFVNENLERVTLESSHTDDIAMSLQETVFGQDEACRALARRIAIFESGLSNPDRPLGVELFLGPTGTGKTEMSHALATHLFHDRNSEQLKIIDCAEFSQGHSTSSFTGAPPSYIGYGDELLISEDFLANRNIIVFDEIEKAHPDLHKLLLGIMEDGRMRFNKKDGQGVLNFSNSIIILTSNVGVKEAQALQEGKGRIGFGQQDQSPRDTNQENKQVSLQALRNMFAPEFINRIDDIVVFKELEDAQFDLIFNKFLNEINDIVVQRNENAPFIAATVEFKDFILGKIDRRYGARDIKRHLDRELLENIADIFMGVDIRGSILVADRDPKDGNTYFYTDEQLTRERRESERDTSGTILSLGESTKVNPQAHTDKEEEVQ